MKSPEKPPRGKGSKDRQMEQDHDSLNDVLNFDFQSQFHSRHNNGRVPSSK